MHTVMWTFKVPDGTSKAALVETINATAHTYEGIPGLIRKYYGTDVASMEEILAELGGGVEFGGTAGIDAKNLEAEANSTPIIRYVDLVLYQAGVDPWQGDRLGRLQLSRDGLVARDRWIAGLFRDRGIPLASTLGGGYGSDEREVAERHVATILTLGTAFVTSRAGAAVV